MFFKLTRSTQTHTRSRAWPLIGAILAATTVLVACNPISVLRIVYNQADNFIHWSVKNALDLNPAQAKRLDRQIDQWFAQHRQTQLPAYAQWFEQASKEAKSDITAQLACQRQKQLQGFVERALASASPHVAQTMLSLSPDQITHLQQFFEESNEEFKADFLPEKEKDQQRAAYRFGRKWLEFIYGRFDAPQKEFLKNQTAQFPLQAIHVDRLRLKYQEEFMALTDQLRHSNASPAQAEKAYARFFQNMITPAQEPQKSDMARWIKAGCQFASDLHHQSSAEQKNRVSQRFAQWAKDLRILSKEK